MLVLYIKWLATDNYITIHVNVMDVMLHYVQILVYVCNCECYVCELDINCT